MIDKLETQQELTMTDTHLDDPQTTYFGSKYQTSVDEGRDAELIKHYNKYKEDKEDIQNTLDGLSKLLRPKRVGPPEIKPAIHGNGPSEDNESESIQEHNEAGLIPGNPNAVHESLQINDQTPYIKAANKTPPDLPTKMPQTAVDPLSSAEFKEGPPPLPSSSVNSASTSPQMEEVNPDSQDANTPPPLPIAKSKISPPPLPNHKDSGEKASETKNSPPPLPQDKPSPAPSLSANSGSAPPQTEGAISDSHDPNIPPPLPTTKPKISPPPLPNHEASDSKGSPPPLPNHEASDSKGSPPPLPQTNKTAAQGIIESTPPSLPTSPAHMQISGSENDTVFSYSNATFGQLFWVYFKSGLICAIAAIPIKGIAAIPFIRRVQKPFREMALSYGDEKGKNALIEFVIFLTSPTGYKFIYALYALHHLTWIGIIIYFKVSLNSLRYM